MGREPRTAVREALLALEGEGVLTAGQRAAVEGRLQAALAPAGDRTSRFVGIVAAIGGILVGAGILYLIGFNWDELSKAAKLAIVFGVWIGFHAAGFALAQSPGRYPRVGLAFTLVGLLCFGGAIGLVAQIYHLTAEYPNSVLVWWVLSVPFVLLTRSRAALLLVVALFLAWIFWHTGVYLEATARNQHDESFVAGFALVGAGLAGLFSALAGWAAGSRYAPLGPVLAVLARPAAIGAAYALSFREFWRGRLRQEGLHGEAYTMFAGIVVAAFVVLALDRRRLLAIETYVFLGTGAALAASLWLWPPGVFLFANLLLLLGILGLIATGIRRGRPLDINLGIATFLLCMVTRYVEYLWDKLEGGFAFIGIGLLLLGVGWLLERNRRRWVAMSAGRPA